MKITKNVVVFAALATFSISAFGQSHSLSEVDKALIQGAFDGDLAKVQKLIEKGASLEATGPKDRSALLWASANGHTDVVEFLHSKGADIDAGDSNNQTALMFAIKGSHVDTVAYLLENGADVNVQSKKRRFTALIVAASVGNIDIVNMLLERGADASITERDGYTALDRARQYEHPEVASRLEEFGETSGS